jgi:hypothetical protein
MVRHTRTTNVDVMTKGNYIQSQLDLRARKAQSRLMSRLLRLFLVFGAIIGLLGQEAAFAGGPSFANVSTPVSMPVAASAMTPECAEMMKPQAPDKTPCKGLTLDCIAKMGCSIPMALWPASPDPIGPVTLAALITQIPVTSMADRTLLPDKQPPKPLI